MPLFDSNISLSSDIYKFGQWPQYPPGTEYIYSYFESRGGLFEECTFAGLQYILARYFKAPTYEQVEFAREWAAEQFGTDKLFNYKGWKYVAELGYLPVRVKAIPEGMTVPVKNILMSIENTDPKCYWLTNWLETILVQLWYGTTVCSNSRECKKVIYRYLRKNGTPEAIDQKLVDFGFRGATSVESAAIGGFAHLINFAASETPPALLLAREYYNCPMAARGIPASEHSTITSWGQDREVDAMRNMIKTYGDYPVYACVSDSYDIYRACRDYWGGVLKNEVLAAKGTLLVRPDSGPPPEVDLKCANILWDKFGGKLNLKGYRVLNDKVRLIQGDRVDVFMLREILEGMDRDGLSSDNIGFGSGGGLLQKLDRDTLMMAFKCSMAIINGFQTDVFKQPITDNGKMSKRGYLSLIPGANGKLKTINKKDMSNDILREVWVNGEFKVWDSLDKIRERANVGL